MYVGRKERTNAPPEACHELIPVVIATGETPHAREADGKPGHCERSYAKRQLWEITRPTSSTRTIGVPGFANGGIVPSRAASCTELHCSRGTEGSNPLLQYRRGVSGPGT
jgi:hypothetical protein